MSLTFEITLWPRGSRINAAYAAPGALWDVARGRTPGCGGEFTLPQNQISFRIPSSHNRSDAFHVVSPFVRICKLTSAQKSRPREYSDEQTKERQETHSQDFR